MGAGDTGETQIAERIRPSVSTVSVQTLVITYRSVAAAAPNLLFTGRIGRAEGVVRRLDARPGHRDQGLVLETAA